MGKTALAVAAAERCGAEIVSADAFQVYAGLEILTAQPTVAERGRVPHHLVGVVSPRETWSVARFLERVHPCLADIGRRGRPALVVGGNGLYVKALTHGLAPLPPANPELRAELEELGLEELTERLQRLDPAGAALVDCANKRRLVRAVEICLTAGKPYSEHRAGWGAGLPVGPARPRGVFLTCPRPELHARIARRVADMFSRDVVAEVHRLTPEELGPTAEQTLGLAEIRDLLRGELALPECQRRIEAATRQYAKRQNTWFKREAALFPPHELHPLAPAGVETAVAALADAIRHAPALCT